LAAAARRVRAPPPPPPPTPPPPAPRVALHRRRCRRCRRRRYFHRGGRRHGHTAAAAARGTTLNASSGGQPGVGGRGVSCATGPPPRRAVLHSRSQRRGRRGRRGVRLPAVTPAGGRPWWAAGRGGGGGGSAGEGGGGGAPAAAAASAVAMEGAAAPPAMTSGNARPWRTGWRRRVRRWRRARQPWVAPYGAATADAQARSAQRRRSVGVAPLRAEVPPPGRAHDDIAAAGASSGRGASAFGYARRADTASVRPDAGGRGGGGRAPVAAPRRSTAGVARVGVGCAQDDPQVGQVRCAGVGGRQEMSRLAAQPWVTVAAAEQGGSRASLAGRIYCMCYCCYCYCNTAQWGQTRVPYRIVFSC